jgi:hypothetical protein
MKVVVAAAPASVKKCKAAAAPPMKAAKAKAAKAAKGGKKPKPHTFIVPAGGKKPKASFKPMHYNGGRIYWSKSKMSWRVYLRKVDKVEVSVHLGANADTAEKGVIDKQWRKCLKAIDLDPRPMVE